MKLVDSLQPAALLHAKRIADGEPLARAACRMKARFWAVRHVSAAFVFDLRRYLLSTPLRVGYDGTNLVFSYTFGVAGWTAWNGGAP